MFKKSLLCAALCFGGISAASAALVTDADDARAWQGATVGTFASLYFGSDTLANRQLVVNNNMLDDGIFNAAGYTAGTLVSGGGGCLGTSYSGLPDPYAYTCGGGSVSTYANAIDNLWFQTNGVVGQTVFDLGALSTKAAVFAAVDHGPLPQETIESTVYLSNDQVNWTQASVQRVWLQGYIPDSTAVWDGFVYAVGTSSNTAFRYLSIIHGGPGALVDDDDDEINGVMGLQTNFVPSSSSSSGGGGGGNLPEPSTLALLGLAALGLGASRRRPSA